jgi:hypothetical protein
MQGSVAFLSLFGQHGGARTSGLDRAKRSS